MNILEQFVEDLKLVYGDNLESAVLFGSKATDEAGASSDHNVLVVLKRFSFDSLAGSAKIMQNWTKAGNRLPVVFTAQELKDSADVFPIEFLDMKSAHRVLYGSDVLAAVEVTDKNLRHECEYEIKTLLLKLRQGAMLHAREEKKLAALMIDSLSSVLTVFRHAVKLSGKATPASKSEALGSMAEIAGVNKDIFAKILGAKGGDKKAFSADVAGIFEEYLGQIEKVSIFINSL